MYVGVVELLRNLPLYGGWFVSPGSRQRRSGGFSRGPRGAGIRRLTGNRKLKATYTKRERLIRHTGLARRAQETKQRRALFNAETDAEEI